jgi:ABC-type multidrug transport system permease subunit
MNKGYKPFIQLIIIRFLEFVRQPGIIFWAIIFPVMMAWVLGVAFGKKGELEITIALVSDVKIENQELKDFLLAGNKNGRDNVYYKNLSNEKLGTTKYKFIPTTWDSAVVMVKQGKTNIIIKESADSLLYFFDPANSEAKLAYIMLATAIGEQDLIYDSGKIKPFTKTGTRYIDFLIPGLIAMGIMNSIMWGISYGLIDIRVKKLLRRMVATPMKKSSFLLSHFVARVMLSAIEALILLGFSYYFFEISIQGSIAALVVIFLAGNFAFAGIAILIASRVSDSRVGTGLINLIILPMTILSGIFFSYHNFPEGIIPVIKVLPLTMLADSTRAIFIEGAGFERVWSNVILLTSIGGIGFILGLRFYKWY